MQWQPSLCISVLGARVPSLIARPARGGRWRAVRAHMRARVLAAARAARPRHSRARGAGGARHSCAGRVQAAPFPAGDHWRAGVVASRGPHAVRALPAAAAVSFFSAFFFSAISSMILFLVVSYTAGRSFSFAASSNAFSTCSR